MKEEVKRWIMQGEADLNTALKNLEISIYYASVQFSHQAVEKTLKGLYIHKFQKMPPKTHSLIRLGREVSVPEERYSSLYSLNPEYMRTKYPDAAFDIPAVDYSRETAKKQYENAKEVVLWAQKEIEK